MMTIHDDEVERRIMKEMTPAKRYLNVELELIEEKGKFQNFSAWLFGSFFVFHAQ
jgi:hypothetical protein